MGGVTKPHGVVYLDMIKTMHYDEITEVEVVVRVV